MMLKKIMIAALLAAGLATSACASDADVLREVKDRAEIQKLMWDYCRALDTMNEDAYADVFTPDGQFGSGQRASKGRDALKKIVADVRKSRAEREAKGEKQAPMHHVITNQHIEFIDKDHARHHSYWMTVFGSSSREAPPRVAAVGTSVDDLVRVNGKWLIQLRNVAPES